jgi:hypothetical protein
MGVEDYVDIYGKTRPKREVRIQVLRAAMDLHLKGLK